MFVNIDLGQIIGGRYKITAELGRGAFGKTYLAEDIQIPGNPKCVVKQFKPLAQDANTLEIARDLFVREAKTLSKIGNDHPQIPRLLAYYPQSLCLIQEFIAGQDLRQAEIIPGHKLSEEQVVSILKDSLQVLQYIHGQGVIHRDIKPSNIIRRYSDRQLVLIDFGAVKEVSSLQTNIQGQTQVTVAIGTPGFMPSEQQMGRPCYSSDIYALGIMAIEALTGVSPVKLQEDPRFGKQLLLEDTKISRRLAEIIDKMVRVDWRERYQSAQEVLDDLANLKQQEPIRLGKWLKFLIPAAIVTGALLATPLIWATYRYHQANSLVKQGQYTDAISIYNQILDVFPGAVKTLVSRGFAYSQLKQYSEMLDSCQQAVEVEPELIDAINCTGLAYTYLGQFDSAIAAFRQALEIAPNYYIAWNNLGNALRENDQPREALEAFEKAITYKDDYLFAWHNRASALYEIGDRQRREGNRSEAQEYYLRAIAAFSRTIEIDPEYFYAWLGRGNANRILGNYQEALEDYNQAIELNSRYYEAYYSKALALLATDECQQALEALDRAIKIKPDYIAAINKRQEVRQTCSR